MKPFWIVPLFAGAMLAAAPITVQVTLAQDNSGTAAEGRGSTGWTGGNRGPTGAVNPEAAKGQPFMASGLDLKGPPQQFPPGQTPE
jgi:hypothetical protein